jgi:hypothetical protein
MNILRKFPLPVVTIFMLAWLPIFWLAGNEPEWLRAINLVTLFIILVGCLGAAAAHILGSPVRLWFPITWFLLTAAAYYGFGPLLYYFGTAETIEYSNAFYYVGDFELYRANLLNLVGIVSVMGMYLLLGKYVARRHSEQIMTDYHRKSVQHALRRISIIFVSIGIPVKLLLVLPRSLGLSDEVLPGGVEYFAVLSTIALAPLFILYRSNKTKYALPFFLLLFFEGGTAIVMLSKLAILKVGITLLLAAVLTGTRFKRLIIIGLIVAFVYGVVLTPLITLSRIQYGAKGLTSLSDTQSALDSFALSGREDIGDLLPGVQSWWSRLNYANAQSFAMTAYDQGRPGDTFALLLYAFVPRILYPEKPIMTSGVEFNVVVNGNPDSQSAPGMFAEAYWNGGWPLALFAFLSMGALYWAWELYAKRKVAYLRLAYMPVIWMGLFSAIQQDSWFVPGIVGVLPIAFAFHLLALLYYKRYSRTLPFM